MFVNRARELKALRERLESENFEFIVIYGRRRIGKTRLVFEAIKGKEYVYYLAVEGDNLSHFKKQAVKVVPEIKHVKEDWESYFAFLKNKIVVIDEFPNLIKEDPKVVSIFQRIIDDQFRNSKTKLIILGSSISMISDKILSYKSPLYGRRTASVNLKPMKFHEIREFFPSLNWDELVEIYGFSDGIPYYLEKVKVPFWKWLEEELSKVDTFLKDEIDFLLKYEFTEVSTYKKILEALAYGKNTMKEIREFAKMKHSDITPYLKNLIETGFVVREVPVTESQRSKKGRYRIADNFVSFWFRFIFPNISAIEEGYFSVEEIKRDYHHYLGGVFEKVAKELLIELNKMRLLPFRFSKIGKWWSKEDEIDLVALDENSKKALFVEVRFKDLEERDVERIIGRLERKVERSEFEGYEKHFGVVAKRVESKELAWDLRDFDIVASQSSSSRS